MTEQTQQAQGFTPEDLVQAVLLIDEGVNQGAYRGWEQVQKAAATRAKLLAFAQNWQATIEAQAAQSVAEVAPVPEVSE
jgi:hypothetical protein